MEMLLPEETQLNCSGKKPRMVRISPQTAMQCQPPRPLCPLCLGKDPLLPPNATHVCANTANGHGWLPLTPMGKEMGHQSSGGK